MKVQRPGRLVAVVGAVAAVSATGMIAMVGGASAAEPGRCVETVNVRAEPDINSRIVAVCEAGTEVVVGETRDGFVKLNDLGGWSAQQFVSINGADPVVPAATDDASESEGDSSSEDASSESDSESEDGDGGARPAPFGLPLGLPLGLV